jgi:hypothetical protein
MDIFKLKPETMVKNTKTILMGLGILTLVYLILKELKLIEKPGKGN